MYIKKKLIKFCLIRREACDIDVHQKKNNLHPCSPSLPCGPLLPSSNELVNKFELHMLEINFEELYGQSSVVREEALECKAQRDAACSELVCVCRQLACVRSLLSIFSHTNSSTSTRTHTCDAMMHAGQKQGSAAGDHRRERQTPT
jgi:hypothetical protein